MADNADFDIEITRVFDAPPVRVFRAFIDPDQLPRWYGPPGFPVPRETVEIEPHVGGHIRFAMAAKAIQPFGQPSTCSSTRSSRTS